MIEYVLRDLVLHLCLVYIDDVIVQLHPGGTSRQPLTGAPMPQKKQHQTEAIEVHILQKVSDLSHLRLPAHDVHLTS